MLNKQFFSFVKEDSKKCFCGDVGTNVTLPQFNRGGGSKIFIPLDHVRPSIHHFTDFGVKQYTPLIFKMKKDDISIQPTYFLMGYSVHCTKKYYFCYVFTLFWDNPLSTLYLWILESLIPSS